MVSTYSRLPVTGRCEYYEARKNALMVSTYSRLPVTGRCEYYEARKNALMVSTYSKVHRKIAIEILLTTNLSLKHFPKDGTELSMARKTRW